jgi:hypothetical protein
METIDVKSILNELNNVPNQIGGGHSRRRPTKSVPRESYISGYFQKLLKNNALRKIKKLF